MNSSADISEWPINKDEQRRDSPCIALLFYSPLMSISSRMFCIITVCLIQKDYNKETERKIVEFANDVECYTANVTRNNRLDSLIELNKDERRRASSHLFEFISPRDARNDFPTVGHFVELEEIFWHVIDSWKIEARFVNSGSDMIFLLERSHHFSVNPSYRSRCAVMALSSIERSRVPFRRLIARAPSKRHADRSL